MGKKLQDPELVTNHLNRVITDQVTGNYLLFDCSDWRTIFTTKNQEQIVFTSSLLNHQKIFFKVKLVSCFLLLLKKKNLCPINASKSDIASSWCLERLVSVYHEMSILWLWFFFFLLCQRTIWWVRLYISSFLSEKKQET